MKIFYALFLFSTLYANAQTTPTKKIDWMKAFKKEGQPVPLYDSYKDIVSGKTINFDSLTQSSFIYVGHATCPPCRYELPYFIQLAAAHRETNFIYITFDDSTFLRQELGNNYASYPNLFYLHVETKYIIDNKLAYGYPTKYYIDNTRKIKKFDLGGTTGYVDNVATKADPTNELLEMISN